MVLPEMPQELPDASGFKKDNIVEMLVETSGLGRQR